MVESPTEGVYGELTPPNHHGHNPRPSPVGHQCDGDNLSPTHKAKKQRTEHLLVCDGHSPVLAARCRDTRCRYVRLRNGPHHDYGATAHQLGIEHAIGEWICFWDDDNVYFSHALEAVLNAIRFPGDIHVLQTRHYGDGQRFRVIPPSSWRPPEFIHACIDTMCLVVKREFALQESWIDDHLGERGSDFRWLQRLSRHNPKVAFWPTVIGAHT